MKVVIRKDTQEEVYMQEPEFEEGKGILSAVALYGGTPDDYAEIEI